MNVDNRIQDVRSAPPVGPINAVVGVVPINVLSVPLDAEFLIEYMELTNNTGGALVITFTDSFVTCGGATPLPVIGVYAVPANTTITVTPKDKMVMKDLLAVASGASINASVHGRNLRGFYTN